MSRDDNLWWFHGKLSRENAEELIKQEGKEDGAFLIRESSTAVGDFVLTLLYQNEVCHYQIRRHGEDAFFSIDDKVKILHGLDTLVEFYQQAANGLVTKLTTRIKKDLPPNDSRSHGVTNLLHRATKENNLTIVSELLKCGYRNVDAKNQDGQTAVHLAALFCDETILEVLLNAGVNVNCMDASGNMPLHYACRSKSATFIRILIDAHANVQGRNIKNGYVPLHEAAKYGNLEAVKELLHTHAPLLPRTKFGEFPIDLAKESNRTDVTEFLNNYKTPAASTFESKWYHGTLKREEAVEMLMKFAANMEKSQREEASTLEPTAAEAVTVTTGEVNTVTETASEVFNVSSAIKEVDTSGCFLVRYSERKTAGSGYVLTMLWDKNVKHFIISQSTNYLYIDDGPYLPSLEHLVEHFMRFSDGLPVSLKHPVLPKPKPPLPLCSTMPRVNHHKKAGTAMALTQHESKLHKEEMFRKHSLDEEQHNKMTAEKHSLTLTNMKKKPKENSSSMFNTLKLRSPKKSMLFDGVNSLRKSKFKPKDKRVISVDEEKSRSQMTEDELKKAEPLFKNLSFSTDFTILKLSGGEPASREEKIALELNNTDMPSGTTTDGFYNVPKNNAAIGTNAAAIFRSCSTDSHNSNASPIAIESKTEAEVDYFTKSDVAIEKERMTAMMTSTAEEFPNCVPPKFATNANGYVATVDVRIFFDQKHIGAGDVFSKEALEASAAELREFSNHPERLDSLISNASNESDIMRYFNRQNSSASTITQSSEAATGVVGVPQTKLNYFIPRDNLEFDAIIGEGEFGSVYKGWLIRRNSDVAGAEERCEVAIKTLHDEHCRSNKQEFLREASVMIRLQHHCIVQLIGISKGKTLMMVQEIVPLGSMLHFILEHRDLINPNHELKLWASQVACGMQYLESHHFVHRDLAARNILLASRNQAKISDFGLSRALGTGNECYQASQGGKWPIKWYAPESFNNGLFSHASDVWSFGVTLWEMFSLGEPPYGDIRGVEAITLIESGQRLPQPQLCPDHVYEIMKNCWNYKPKDRPTFRYLTDFFAKDPDYQNLMELIKTEHIS